MFPKYSNVVLGNFVEPMLLGKRFGISAAVVVLSVVFWGWLWGITGMFLAVPLTMLLKVSLSDSEEFGWFSIFIGSSSADVNTQQCLIFRRINNIFRYILINLITTLISSFTAF